MSYKREFKITRIRQKYAAQYKAGTLVIEGRKINVYQAAEIYKLKHHGYTALEIGKRYGVNESMVTHIWHERHWKGCVEVVAFLDDLNRKRA